MTERLSLADYKATYAKPANKYSASAIVEDGLRFDSKLEARRYRYWKNLWQLGAIAWFTRQVPFYLPGGIVWRADFLVVTKQNPHVPQLNRPPEVIIEDCKGAMTRVSLNKIKQVEAIYGFKVQIIKKGDFR
jgi:hypothetical protein